MSGRSGIRVTGMIVGWAGLVAVQAASAQNADTDALVRQALSAGPKHVTVGASVMAPGPDGVMKELKHGGNGWTCMPDNPESPGKDPMCVDQEGLKFIASWVAHEERPANTAPGLSYMLQGGSDISANDPWAKADRNTKFIESPPHYMVLWPFDPKSTGLSDKPKSTGSWIMWAGTPYAHLMVNQTP